MNNDSAKECLMLSARPASAAGVTKARRTFKAGRVNNGAFTLAEVVVSLGLAVMTFGGILFGYMQISNRAQWSAYSLAAQSLAMQGVEQARGAKWDPQSWPPIDELGVTNFTQVSQLDVPQVAGTTVYATNNIYITSAQAYPPLRQLRADCVWSMPSRRSSIAGPFTNTVITLRAPDQ